MTAYARCGNASIDRVYARTYGGISQNSSDIDSVKSARKCEREREKVHQLSHVVLEATK